MRIATYNVHDCIGMDERFDASRIATVLTELNADVIALQEVTLDTHGELVELFEQATAMQAIDGTLFDRGVGRYGNLVLSRHPVSDNCIHDISTSGRELRGVIEMAVTVDQKPLQIYATHLGLKFFERRSQIERLASLLPVDQPSIVMGDFNIWGLSIALRPLHKLGYTARNVNSFPTSPLPLFALDRILVNSSMQLRRCWRHTSPLARQASDHFPIVAELDISLL